MSMVGVTVRLRRSMMFGVTVAYVPWYTVFLADMNLTRISPLRSSSEIAVRSPVRR